jgi:hypothetical protein
MAERVGPLLAHHQHDHACGHDCGHDHHKHP